MPRKPTGRPPGRPRKSPKTQMEDQPKTDTPKNENPKIHQTDTGTNAADIIHDVRNEQEEENRRLKKELQRQTFKERMQKAKDAKHGKTKREEEREKPRHEPEPASGDGASIGWFPEFW